MNGMKICITLHLYLMYIVFLDSLCVKAVDDLSGKYNIIK